MRRPLIFAFIVSFPGLCLAEQIEVIDLLHLNAPQFAAALAGGKSSSSELLDAEAVDFALDAMREADRRTRTVRRPSPMVLSRGRSVAEGAADLSHLLPDGLAGPPVAAPNRNALIVRGDQEAIDELREIIAMLDVPTPMVNVELAVNEISTADARRIYPTLRAWGWGGDLSAGRLSEPVLGFHVGDLAGLLGYQVDRTRRHTMTAANVTGMSGNPMVISVGEVRPWIRSEVYFDPWGRRQVHYWTEAIFVGVTFWVLPTVHADDTVSLVLRPVLSEAAGPAAQVGAGQVIRRRLVETTVRVPDGQPLVIGGLDRRADDLSRSFPASGGEMRTDSSSVMTVTPHIIRTVGDVR